MGCSEFGCVMTGISGFTGALPGTPPNEPAGPPKAEDEPLSVWASRDGGATVNRHSARMRLCDAICCPILLSRRRDKSLTLDLPSLGRHTVSRMANVGRNAGPAIPAVLPCVPLFRPSLFLELHREVGPQEMIGRRNISGKGFDKRSERRDFPGTMDSLIHVANAELRLA